MPQVPSEAESESEPVPTPLDRIPKASTRTNLTSGARPRLACHGGCSLKFSAAMHLCSSPVVWTVGSSDVHARNSRARTLPPFDGEKRCLVCPAGRPHSTQIANGVPRESRSIATLHSFRWSALSTCAEKPHQVPRPKLIPLGHATNGECLQPQAAGTRPPGLQGAGSLA